MIQSISIEQYFRDIIKSVEPIIGKGVDITFKVGLDWSQLEAAQTVKPPAALISYKGWAPNEEIADGIALGYTDNYTLYILLAIGQKDDTGTVFRHLRRELMTDPELLIADDNYNVIVGNGTASQLDHAVLYEINIEVENA